MTFGRTLIATAAGLWIALSGCMPPQSGDPERIPAAPASESDCGASQLGDYVGIAATDDVIARLHEWHGGKPMRVVRPGMAVTMDYSPDRLNVMLDDAGIILRFTCS